MRTAKSENTIIRPLTCSILLLGIVDCMPSSTAPSYIAPRYVTADTGTIAANDGVLITIIETDGPMTLLLANEDPANHQFQRIKLKQGRNIKIMFTLAGNYSWHSACSSRGCADFSPPLTFKIEKQSINYIGNEFIQDVATGYSMFSVDYDYEVIPQLELIAKIRSTHPFVTNIATDGHLHLHPHFRPYFR